MFKWLIILMLLGGVLSSPINQNGSSDSNLPISKDTSMYIDFAKGTAKNLLIITNNILDIIIENMDKPSDTQEKKIDMQNL